MSRLRVSGAWYAPRREPSQVLNTSGAFQVRIIGESYKFLKIMAGTGACPYKDSAEDKEFVGAGPRACPLPLS